VSRVAAKIGAGQEKGKERIREYGRALRRTRPRFSPQPEGTRAFRFAGVVARRSWSYRSRRSSRL